MRISDWSSDVCSSDLVGQGQVDTRTGAVERATAYACEQARDREQAGGDVPRRQHVVDRPFDVLVPGEHGYAVLRVHRIVHRGAAVGVALDVDRKSTRLNSSH